MGDSKDIEKMIKDRRLSKDERKIVVHNLTEMVSIVVHNMEKVPKDAVSIVVHNLTEMVSIVVHNLEKKPDPKEFMKIVVHNLDKIVKG